MLMQAPTTATNRSHSSSSTSKDKVNNNPSPQQLSSPEDPTPKFRYPSGNPGSSSHSVQSSSSPHAILPDVKPDGGGESSSALSSREGTPLPAAIKSEIKHEIKYETPAPNVDISRVQIKDFYSDFSPPPSAQQQSSSPFAAQQMRSPRPNNYPFYSQMEEGKIPAAAAAAVSSGGGNHGHVKIGRRPAHLPKVLKFSDKTLPPGWQRKLKQRKHGKQAGRWDVYIYSPCGVKFASRKKLKGFFEKNNLTYDPEDFDFTPYGRHMDSRASNPSGGSGGSSASRHNSSGSSSSPASAASVAQVNNYSPNYAAAAAAAATLGPYDCSFGSFSQFDPHMESPPNECALNVPSGGSGGGGGAVADFGYHHLGRGHHHPIVNKETTGIDFFPMGDMGDMLCPAAVVAAGTGDSVHNGFGSSYGLLLQPLSNTSAGSSEEEKDDTSRMVKGGSNGNNGGSQTPNNNSSSSILSSLVQQQQQQQQQPQELQQLLNASAEGSNNRFSLGRTMSVLHSNQDGYDEFGGYGGYD